MNPCETFARPLVGVSQDEFDQPHRNHDVGDLSITSREPAIDPALITACVDCAHRRSERDARRLIRRRSNSRTASVFLTESRAVLAPVWENDPSAMPRRTSQEMGSAQPARKNDLARV